MLQTASPADRETLVHTITELTGQVLNGRYLIERELDRGGMGAVYFARDQQLHSRPVVVKVLLDEAFKSEYVVQKFGQEIEALSRLDHPGIVGIIDAGELADRKPFIVMQYVEGVSLRSAMAPEGMKFERVADLIRQIGRALASAHERGICHRDLKPDNIMLQQLGQGEEQIKVIDFGIAKVKDSIIAPTTALNISPGTVLYMAPEQLSGRPITAATDVYALGAIAYEMLTGRRPFNPETGFELLQMQEAGVRIRPSDLRPSLAVSAERMILKALSLNPIDRYQSAREFGDGLALALTGNDKTDPYPGLSGNLPKTELAAEETPIAGQSAHFAGSPAFIPPINPSAAQLGLSGRTTSARGSKVGPILGALALIVAVGVVAVWYVRTRTGAVAENPAPTVERVLTYGLTVQKMREGNPYQESFESTGKEVFENGWKFRVHLASPQSGYLYLLNEGPTAGGDITYNLLFPAPEMNSGSSYVADNQTIETGWMVFDEHQGTEKFWMVWSAEAVPELESVKGAVNEKSKGTISDEGQSKSVGRVLSKYSAAATPHVETDRTKKQTSVKNKGNTLVHLIELEHR